MPVGVARVRFRRAADAGCERCARSGRMVILIPIKGFIDGNFVASNVEFLSRVVASLMLVSVAALFLNGGGGRGRSLLIAEIRCQFAGPFVGAH